MTRQQLSFALGALLGLVSCRAAEPVRTSDGPVAPGQPTSSPATACGGPGQAECPTQRWMKSTLQAYLRTHDYKRLEASFKQLAAHAPPGYEQWQALAQSGARAAADQDEGQVRQTCQSCHDGYRAQFRREIRGTPLL